MYIEPKSTIRIYSGVPFDDTYTHTVWFNSLTAQREYFSTNIKYYVNNYTYIRTTRNAIRVELKAEQLYNCNYIAFQNTSFGNKWFYAFITNVTYINNETSEIEFDIDVMQTYLFDIELLDCFVEREHSATDNVGDNIISENFEIGEYFNGTIKPSELFDEYTVAMISPYTFVGSQPVKAWTDREITNNPCVLVNFYYGGSTLDDALTAFSVDLLNLDEAGHSDEISAVYMLPRKMLPNLPEGTFRGKLPTNRVIKSVNYGTKPTTLGTYRPRNKKLLTYPYNKFTITNYQETHDYRYEYFSGDEIIFTVYGNLTPNCSFKAVPSGYKNNLLAFDEGIVMSNFPMVAYSSNTFAEWYARNKTQLATNALFDIALGGSAIGDIVSGSQMLTPKTQVLSARGADRISKGVEKMLDNSLAPITNLVATSLSARTLGSTTQGSLDGSLEIAMQKKDFIYQQKYLNPQYAKIVDDYFDMFGYATREVKKPNRNVRPHWTYTKTQNCMVKGEAPTDAINDICKIYNNGITFWKNANEVGNYSLDNTI